MGKPAARIGDGHSCSMINPGGVPHIGGPVIGPGCTTVWIEKKPAATVGDACVCIGEPDTITSGSSGVFIGGKPAARQGDQCAHGGMVITGSKTVFIGEVKGRRFFKEGDEDDKKDEFVEPSNEEKVIIIKQAIKDCIALLERKLKLMEQKDTATLDAFEKWFGRSDDEAKEVILNRIRRALEVSKGLTVENFQDIMDEDKKRKVFAEIYPDDNSFKIFLGNKFWKANITGKDSRGGVIVHELSHSNSIGKTFDYVRGEEDCLLLSESDPKDALYNADSFEYFIEL